MAQAIFSRLAEERGLALSFRVDSFATSSCEEGNPVYPPAQRVLKERGYSFSHRAKQISLQDVHSADYVLVMDGQNYSDITSLTGGNYADKIFKLGHFLPTEKDIDDPWYTRDFERTYRELYASCSAFLEYLITRHAQMFDYDSKN